MKKVAIGLLSLIARIALVFAILFTSLNLLFNELNHSGDIAVLVLTKISTSDSAISSAFDEIKKSAIPELAVKLEKKEAALKEAITKLGTSLKFREAVARPFNKLSRGLLSGEGKVTIDFSEAATLLAKTVNQAVGTSIITRKELSTLTIITFDVPNQLKILSQVQEKSHLWLLFWILWILSILGIYFIKRGVFLKSVGWQLASLGLPIIILKLFSPLLINQISIPVYVKEVLLQLVNSLYGPVFILGVTIFILGGVILVSLKIKTSDRLPPK